MPVTAKLSRQFYEKLGDEVANELVEWLNQMTLSYRTELRDLNELNFVRSGARVDQRFAEFELKIDRRLSGIDARTNQRFMDLEAKIDRRSVVLEARIDSGLERVRSEMVSFKAELIKWMFLFWLGTVATTLAISQALR